METIKKAYMRLKLRLSSPQQHPEGTLMADIDEYHEAVLREIERLSGEIQRQQKQICDLERERIERNRPRVIPMTPREHWPWPPTPPWWRDDPTG